jgi:D-xylose transport system permease protein
MRQTAIVGILSSGMVLIIVAGHIDLSIGSIVALTGGRNGHSKCVVGLNHTYCYFIGIANRCCFGIVNGYLIAYQKIPAFIVTLGGMLIYRGMVKGLTKGETVGPLSDALQFGGSGYLPVMGKLRYNGNNFTAVMDAF